MNEWCIFWICLFSYYAIRYVIYCLTYDKKKAIKEIVEEESAVIIDEALSRVDAEIQEYIDKQLKSLKSEKGK